MTLTLWTGNASLQTAQSYRGDEGAIVFESSARLENVQAKSSDLKGAVELSKNQFAFSVEINTFEGFNSDLQKEHFRENYMESTHYPKASFAGKLIDPVADISGLQKIRAKGVLTIHGVSQDRIIDVQVTKSNNGLKIHSSFYVALSQHNIVIPKLVFQKIAETIQVSVETNLKLQ
jgi:polyisoprenoid-binding protein YceI